MLRNPLLRLAVTALELKRLNPDAKLISAVLDGDRVNLNLHLQ